MARILNFNVGVLGHVDSGKTSLAKALSTERSTACFDKNPQSQERGITLDLGFSSFHAEVPEHLAAEGYEGLRYTLVDCPGHASLIRTVIGGAQIIDLMVLVIDIVKGVQTQTAECIVLGEILAKDLVVVLNKTDLVVDTEGMTRHQQISRTVKKIQATFAKTRWPQVPIIPVSASPPNGASPQGLSELVEELRRRTHAPKSTGPPAYEQFLMYVDHCFAIKGQGTVLTGTVLQGALAVGQTLHLPEFKVDKKVKSIQVFRAPVASCTKGDRVGVCVTQFDAATLERGITCAKAEGLVWTYTAAIARVRRVRFYRQALRSNSKVHVTVGHTTVMATVRFFQRASSPSSSSSSSPSSSSFVSDPDAPFDAKDQHRWLPELPPEDTDAPVYAILFLDSALVTVVNATLIAARLDTDVHGPQCRLAFHGTVVHPLEGEEWKRLTVIKDKRKEAQVDRVVDDYTAVVKGLVTKDGDVSRFVGMRIHYEPTAPPDPAVPGKTDPVPRPPVFVGLVEGTFGKAGGRVKVRFDAPVFAKDAKYEGYTLALHYQVNQFDKAKKLMQPSSLGPAASG